MKAQLVGLLILGMAGASTVTAGGWGQTYAIEIRSPQESESLMVTDTQIVESLSFWVGPGSGFSGLLSKPTPERSITNWQAGKAPDVSDKLTVYEVRFLLKPESDPDIYTVLYAPDWKENTGYIYYPRKSSQIVWHGVSDAWMHASERWHDVMGAAVSQRWQLTDAP